MLNTFNNIFPASLRRQIILFVHSGNSIECPYCGYKAKDLAPIGYDFPVLKEKQIIGGGLRNGGCYNCFCSDRERLLYTYFFEESDTFKKTKKLKVLHIAPEPSLSKYLLKMVFEEYVCGDLFTEGYSHPDHVTNMDVTEIPFGDNHFDLVICNHVLEHVPDDKKAMSEIYRVLKTGGKAVLQVPISANNEETFEDFSVIDPKQRELVFGQYDHIRIYGQDYPKKLETIGFSVERLNISSLYPKRGLNPKEDLFVARKSKQYIKKSLHGNCGAIHCCSVNPH
jgi:SAM-dependent methyltransferase